jgi:hypothetical protein
MKTQDGGPVQRDINFLAETRIVPRSLVDRLTPNAASLSGATATTCLADQSEPITLYSEAAAQQELGRFNVSMHTHELPWPQSVIAPLRLLHSTIAPSYDAALANEHVTAEHKIRYEIGLRHYAWTCVVVLCNVDMHTADTP